MSWARSQLRPNRTTFPHDESSTFLNVIHVALALYSIVLCVYVPTRPLFVNIDFNILHVSYQGTISWKGAVVKAGNIGIGCYLFCELLYKYHLLCAHFLWLAYDKFSKLKLQFTANHGAAAVCVGLFRLLKDGKQVAFPSGSKSEHKGIWSDSYHSDNLIGSSGYYCSDQQSFKNNKGNEEVLVTMSSPVTFDSFSLTQHDGMGYNPGAFKLMGLGADNNWILLHEESDFNFKGTKATVAFDTGHFRMFYS